MTSTRQQKTMFQYAIAMNHQPFCHLDNLNLRSRREFIVGGGVIIIGQYFNNLSPPGPPGPLWEFLGTFFCENYNPFLQHFLIQKNLDFLVVDGFLGFTAILLGGLLDC